MKTFALAFSLILNLVLITLLLFVSMVGCAEIADGRIGILTKDLEIGHFADNKKIFMLPKGLVVREASATGAGWFEPHRFRLIITSDNETLVDYFVKKLPSNGQNNEYYSADITSHSAQKNKKTP